MNVILGMKSETSDNLLQDSYFQDYIGYVIWELKHQWKAFLAESVPLCSGLYTQLSTAYLRLLPAKLPQS